MKKTMLALILLLAMPLGFTAPAAAETDIDFGIFLGNNYDRHGYYDDRYRRGYGDRAFRNRISCNQAKRIVRDRGYAIISTRDCLGTQYVFRVKRAGNTFTLNFNARNGRFWRA